MLTDARSSDCESEPICLATRVRTGTVRTRVVVVELLELIKGCACKLRTYVVRTYSSMSISWHCSMHLSGGVRLVCVCQSLHNLPLTTRVGTIDDKTTNEHTRVKVTCDNTKHNVQIFDGNNAHLLDDIAVLEDVPWHLSLIHI